MDLVGEFTEELEQVDSEEVRMPEEGLRINTILSQQTWQLFVDGAANQKGMGGWNYDNLPRRNYIREMLEIELFGHKQ